MSEEKPTFKVTDRRLFNPDGTPREGVERAEEAPPAPPAAEPTHQQGAADAGEQQAKAEGGPEAGAAGGSRERGEESAEKTSQELLMLVEFVASFAADAMGMVAHPGAPAQEEVNLPLARQCIDMLGALRQKTSGRLSAEEQRFLDTILSQLRMQYVSLTSAPRGPQQPSPRGGFSGSDITGGR
ncbi:MAG TPA: DUF1844 domain-containing protein [Pyrinomonadaceae bacterium]|nr:DUF1844 domain-containing protein [Pyrinomonadaceae bacterium]